MERIYESMFLLDNQAVREDWTAAKEIVTGTIEKNGGKVLTARHWDERKLAYPIKRRNRATYLLTYCEVPESGISSMRRDFELNEQVLRYLMLRAEEIPEEERELSAKEQGEDFALPAPPEDDHDETPEAEASGRDSRPARGDNATAKDEAKDEDEETEAEVPAEEAKAPAEKAKAPAEEAKAPAEEAKAPAEEAKAPAEKAKAPAEKAKAPAEKAKAPAETAATAEAPAEAPESTPKEES